MAQNPYEAPEARVADRAVAAAPRPREVSLACRILWVIFVLSFFTLNTTVRGEWWKSPGASDDAAELGYIGIVVVTAIFSALFALLIWQMGRRRNWARWGLLVFVIVGGVTLAGDFSRSISQTPIAAVFDVVALSFEIWACYLIFRGPGARWFAARDHG